jgi:hypothetical protein
MNWLEAVAAMKEGKKVRRKRWEHFYIQRSVNDYVRCGDEMAMGFYGTVEDYEATDWEVVPEPKVTKRVTYYKAYYKADWMKDCIFESSWSTDKDDLIREEDTLIEIEEREFEV